IRDRNVTGVQTCALPIYRSLGRLAVAEEYPRPRIVALHPRSQSQTHADAQALAERASGNVHEGKAWRGMTFEVAVDATQREQVEIGRASCRERVERAVGW